ncbi:MAG: glucose 1-dehydrogenase [Candidatus Omnitrophica bacterium]|nr:glucose 1-dehydrogenase [Candidatus Omnitrophota bacterium]
MNKPLQNKTAVVTGASRGIGRAIALRLAQMGSNVVVNYVRNEEAASQTVQSIIACGVKATAFQANVGDPKACEELIQHAAQELGGVDILIHNAAMGAFKPVYQLKANQWDLSLEINAKALLTLTQKAVPFMEKKGEGNIIAISSLGAHRFLPSYGAIGISKAALETLVKYLAVELAPKKIRVNCVSGGAVETDALRSYPNFAELKKEIARKTPAGRMGEPDDLARVVAFLVSPESNWICGQTLIADGGLSLL